MTHPHKSTTHKERFIHVRPSKGLSDKYSSATIFTRLEDDGIWRAAIALCWKGDQFNRATGRKNARKHYFQNNKINLGTEFNHNQIIKQILEKYIPTSCNCC